MSSASWTPPPDLVTTPDQIEPAALLEVYLLDGERIDRVWRTGHGFLVMTNLRCLDIWHKPLLFAKANWHCGPSFFFYNLAPPRVIARRFLRLSEEFREDNSAVHLLVHDPVEVAAEIETARVAGYSEWLQRRADAEAKLRRAKEAARTAGPVILREVVREVVKVRCNFCGNLMDLASPRCLACGAPNR